ncbi:hypothetical protein BGP77_12930 [Saccharospirillum sp. MSK14-1]|uniref:dioxygenase family protein n=1 Tax=Saccharospirillum sp. MSK14-1 TaxID=1897632 RepID=UPI000D40D97A|nr:protocatechuate dioxygenase [Saccharospirillum sp. MSK14-1]PTY37407.1 hypothetical protein BGP77_12930 [Saccharospirillum sp. MSK14-1]
MSDNNLPATSRRLFLGLAGGMVTGALISASGFARAENEDELDDIQCRLMPRETEGPFPLREVLNRPDLVRRDLTEGLPGVPLALQLKIVDVNNGCRPIEGAGVYVWHCDRDGRYSGYNDARGETFCRGLQFAEGQGVARFNTIYPGWYPGRVTHIHFQVYLEDPAGSRATVTSQLAFPDTVTQAVYNSRDYTERGQNTSVRSVATDSIFADGSELQVVTIEGDPVAGYVARLVVGIAA